MLFAVKRAAFGDTIPVIFYYHRLNRYSFNALAGALDGEPDLAQVPVGLARNADELQAAAADVLNRHRKAVVALSVLTPQVAELRRLVQLLRSAFRSRITIIAGGPHATADARDVLDSGVDIVFRGEAEVTFPRVLRRLAAGEGLQGITGIAWRQGGKVVTHARAGPVEIDSFASFSPKRGMFGPIEITRGCPFACSFCQTSHIFGIQPRHRSIAKIVQQAATLRSRSRRVVRLLSPNAFSYGSPDGRQLNPAAVGELLAALRETVTPGGRIVFGYYPSEVRPEHVTQETLELLRRFADNDEIVIGAQSGSRRMLEACHRSHGVESVLTAVSLARKAGYKVIVDFMFGLPGEGAEDTRQTIAVMMEIARLGARIHPHAFVPLPQTVFSKERPGRIPSDIIRALDQLEERRAIYGDWVEQRRLAHKVYRHLNAARASREGT